MPPSVCRKSPICILRQFLELERGVGGEAPNAVAGAHAPDSPLPPNGGGGQGDRGSTPLAGKKRLLYKLGAHAPLFAFLIVLFTNGSPIFFSVLFTLYKSLKLPFFWYFPQ